MAKLKKGILTSKINQNLYFLSFFDILYLAGISRVSLSRDTRFLIRWGAGKMPIRIHGTRVLADRVVDKILFSIDVVF